MTALVVLTVEPATVPGYPYIGSTDAEYLSEAWGPIIGPSSVCLLRLTWLLAHHETGFVDADVLSRKLGLAGGKLADTMARTARFGLARYSPAKTARGRVLFTVPSLVVPLSPPARARFVGVAGPATLEGIEQRCTLITPVTA